MTRRKVQLADNIKRVITIDDEATIGATLGVNVYRKDGVTVVTEEDLVSPAAGDSLRITDQLAEGNTNLYFTAARVRAVLLTGLSLVTPAAITATDTVLSAFGKLQAQLSAKWDAAIVHAATSKATPVDADELALVDSAAGNALKRLTWANVKATLKTYFDTIYAAAGSSGDVVGPASSVNNRVVFFDGATGKLIKDSGLTLAGTNTGDQTSVTGNAGTATALATPRNIDGQAFDGTANITVIAPGTHAASSKTVAVDADELPLADSAASFALKKLTLANLWTYISGKTYDTWGIAVSDEITAITTGTAKVTFYAPYACTIDEVFTGLTAQSSSGSVTADVNKAGTTIFSTNPSIDVSEDTSLTGTAAVLSTTTLAKGDKLTIDIDSAGTGAKGLKVYFRVHY